MLSVFTSGPTRIDITERGSGIPVITIIGAGLAIGSGIVVGLFILAHIVMIIAGLAATAAITTGSVVIMHRRFAMIDWNPRASRARSVVLPGSEPARTALPATARVMALPAGRSVSEPRVRVRVRTESETRN
jgi:hypothetical protein